MLEYPKNIPSKIEWDQIPTDPGPSKLPLGTQVFVEGSVGPVGPVRQDQVYGHKSFGP